MAPPPPAASILDVLGNTPVVKLQHVVAEGCADVYVKLEYFSATGSYKDRMAKSMIEEAERSGRLARNMTVVEATGGSTGSALAFVCAVKGYPFVALSSNAYANEKLLTMAAFGAKLDITHSPTGKATADLMTAMKRKSVDLSKGDGFFYTDQFSNGDALVGYREIGHELIAQFPDGFDGFCGSFGTCGMVMGVSSVLKPVMPDIRVQSLYQDMSRRPGNPFSGASSAEITLIGSIAASLMKLGAPYVVSWTKSFQPAVVVCSGGLLYGIASVLASFGTTLWHMQLTQGLLIGIATCLSFMPSMVVPPSWFGRHRALCMGIISSGTGVGVLVWSPILTACISELDYQNTLRLTGCVCTVLICISGCALSWELQMAASLQAADTRPSWTTGLFKGPFPPRHLISTRKFVAQSINAFFQSAAYYTPIFYIAAFSKTLGYNETDGANFTALSNACNAIGKFGFGFIADRIGRLHSFFLTALLSCTSTAGLWVSSTFLGSSDIEAGRALFIAFTVIAYIGLFSPALVELFGISEMPHITGIMYMFQGAAGLMGTPLAGLLVTDDTGPGSYLYMAVLVGSFMFISMISVQWARIELMVERAGGKWQWTWGL